jgi:hypothetical protein
MTYIVCCGRGGEGADVAAGELHSDIGMLERGIGVRVSFTNLYKVGLW